MGQASRYVEIAHDILREIKSGKFKPDDRLYSRSEIVSKYRISPVTATRVQNYLAANGIIRKIRGGGIFVLPGAASALAVKLACGKHGKIRKVVFLHHCHSVRKDFYAQLIDEIFTELERKKIPVEKRIFTPSEVSEELHNNFEIEDDAGYIVINNGSISVMYCAAVLLNSSVRSVFIDGILVGSDCVMTDFFDGMEKIVDELVRRGCSRFLYARNFTKNLGGINDAERYYAALYHIKRHGFPCKVIDSGSYHDLLDALGDAKQKKTAVIFPQDAPAGVFCRLLRKHRISNVVVSGFDHFTSTGKTPDILTVEPDFHEIAVAAVKLLLPAKSFRNQIIRVPGKLILPHAETP